MRRPLFAGARRGTPVEVSQTVEAIAVDVVERALPLVDDLQVHAIDDPAWRAGAEAMKDEVLRVLRSQLTPDCGCHPAYHEIGVHAPVGRSRSVTP